MSDEKIKHNYMCDWCCADKTRIFYLCDGHIKLIANNELKKAREEGQKEIAMAWLDVMAGFDKGSDLEKLIYNFWDKLNDILGGDIEKLKSGSDKVVSE